MKKEYKVVLNKTFESITVIEKSYEDKCIREKKITIRYADLFNLLFALKDME